jgi:hypothetical protein
MKCGVPLVFGLDVLLLDSLYNKTLYIRTYDYLCPNWDSKFALRTLSFETHCPNSLTIYILIGNFRGPVCHASGIRLLRPLEQVALQVPCDGGDVTVKGP